MATAVQRLAFAADEFHGMNDRWPDLAELLQLDDTLPSHDFWGHEFRFERTAAGEFRVRSAGVDEVFGSADDILSWPMRGGERYRERVLLRTRMGPSR